MGTPGATDDESPVEVTLTRGFWLAETELTQGQWQKVMGTAPWERQQSVREGDDFPATFISHDDAGAFCQKLTAAEHEAGRMPSRSRHRRLIKQNNPDRGQLKSHIQATEINNSGRLNRSRGSNVE
jgi:formylglycine-generating enzyme required for sulfatase activity